MSVEAEMGVLSVLLRDNSKISEMKISEKHFGVKSNRLIFGAIRTILSNRQIADVITVAEYLGTERNWLDHLSNLVVNSAAAIDNAQAYSKLVEKSFLSREAQCIGEWLKSNSGDSGVVQEAIKKLMSLDVADQNHEYDLNGMMRLGIQSIQDAFERKGEVIGIKTGLNELDESLGGFHDGDLIIVAGRPAMGKTSVLLNMLMGARDRVGCVSGEQGVTQVAQRLLSIQSKVQLSRMRNGRMDDTDFSNLNNGSLIISQHAGIWTYDKSSPSIEDIESMARRWKFEHGIKALYVDYLQKIQRDGAKNKAEAIGDNIARLKDLARELEIPVVVLAQVKREVDNRADKRPNMSDISDTSEAEKEADVVICLYRDEVYNHNSESEGIIELNIEKNRHGPIGRVCASWDGRYLAVNNFHRG